MTVITIGFVEEQRRQSEEAAKRLAAEAEELRTLSLLNQGAVMAYEEMLAKLREIEPPVKKAAVKKAAASKESTK
jgi:hypothetical protein